MAENLYKKHLPFAVHISKEHVKVLCNMLLFVYTYLMKFYWFFILFTLWCNFSKYQIWQFAIFFLEKYFSTWPNFFSKCLLYLILWWIFSSGYGCHRNQENSVFAVPMATVVKKKNFPAYFRKLMWTSIPWEFQPKATIISLKKMLQPAPLFLVTRVQDHLNFIRKN